MILTLMVVVFFACKKGQITHTQSSNNIEPSKQYSACRNEGGPIEVIHSNSGMISSRERLRFASAEDVAKTISYLTDKEEKFLDQWETQFKNFTSMRTFFNVFNNNFENEPPAAFKNYHVIYIQQDGTGECECKRPVNDVYFATLLNAEGIFQVGSEIIQITSDQEKIITDGDETKIPRLKDVISSIPEEHIVVRNIERIGHNTCYNHFDGRYRIVANTIQTTYTQSDGSIVFNRIEFYVKYQRKNFWGCWRLASAPYLRIEGQYGDVYKRGGSLIAASASFDTGYKMNVRELSRYAPSSFTPTYSITISLITGGGGYKARGSYWWHDWVSGSNTIHGCFENF